MRLEIGQIEREGERERKRNRPTVFTYFLLRIEKLNTIFLDPNCGFALFVDRIILRVCVKVSNDTSVHSLYHIALNYPFVSYSM